MGTGLEMEEVEDLVWSVGEGLIWILEKRRIRGGSDRVGIFGFGSDRHTPVRGFKSLTFHPFFFLIIINSTPTFVLFLIYLIFSGGFLSLVLVYCLTCDIKSR